MVELLLKIIKNFNVKKLSQQFTFLTHPAGGAIKPGFLFPLEIFHAKAPVGLNNAQNPVEMLFSGEAYYYKSAVFLQNTF